MLFFSVSLAAGGPSIPHGGQRNLRGLTLWTTLPASQYGPGQEIRIYCTLVNRGTSPVTFTPPLSLTASVTIEGEERSYAQIEECQALVDNDKPVILRPGERWLTCFLVKPPRKEFLPGDYPLRVYCVFAGGGARAGGRDLRGTLVSNEVKLTIHYNVFWVY
jgi:hypothetical protein